MANWPTPVDAEGRTATIVKLMGSSDPATARQGLYLLFSSKAVKDNGYEIEVAQQPLADGGVRITVPLILKDKNGNFAVVYTNSEPWTPDDIAGLRAWILDVRKAGIGEQVPIFVMSHHNSPEVAAVPGICMFLPVPCPELPTGDTSPRPG
jgi:hypothetical protein